MTPATDRGQVDSIRTRRVGRGFGSLGPTRRLLKKLTVVSGGCVLIRGGAV